MKYFCDRPGESSRYIYAKLLRVFLINFLNLKSYSKLCLSFFEKNYKLTRNSDTYFINNLKRINEISKLKYLQKE